MRSLWKKEPSPVYLGENKPISHQNYCADKISELDNRRQKFENVFQVALKERETYRAFLTRPAINWEVL